MSSSSTKKLVDIECKLIRETEAAYLITSLDPVKTGWVPKSQVELGEDTGRDKEDIVTWICTMPTWLAQDKEFI